MREENKRDRQRGAPFEQAPCSLHGELTMHRSARDTGLVGERFVSDEPIEQA
jgi:hypothetical protein